MGVGESQVLDISTQFELASDGDRRDRLTVEVKRLELDLHPVVKAGISDLQRHRCRRGEASGVGDRVGELIGEAQGTRKRNELNSIVRRVGRSSVVDRYDAVDRLSDRCDSQRTRGSDDVVGKHVDKRGAVEQQFHGAIIDGKRKFGSTRYDFDARTQVANLFEGYWSVRWIEQHDVGVWRIVGRIANKFSQTSRAGREGQDRHERWVSEAKRWLFRTGERAEGSDHTRDRCRSGNPVGVRSNWVVGEVQSGVHTRARW